MQQQQSGMKRRSFMSNAVTTVPAAPSSEAEAHFARRLGFETDCWDVHDALSRDPTDFVVLDVRGPRLYEAGHIPGAISLPHGKMTESRMNAWPSDITFVVYCAGPHCNGANKAALRLARLGRPVKEMIGGVTGWADEGFAFAVGAEPGNVADAEAAA
jgi:rhodanese-related sulfurtransferase